MIKVPRALSFGLLLASLTACGQTINNSDAKKSTQNINQTKSTAIENKMKIEIWSDVVCPFCYIGKRKFEIALEQFANKNEVEIVWKSYQLMPDMPGSYSQDVYQLVAEKHGISLEQSKAMHHELAKTAKEVGLVYNFDKAVPVNTVKAHQLIQFAKVNGKQEQAEEALFRSYFTEGKNLGDQTTLLEIGASIGLDKAAIKSALENGTYLSNVKADLEQAQQVGVRGVPFIVFNRKYAASGAQDPKVFLETLQKSFAAWRKENPEKKLEITEGNTCTPDGECK